jgi:hypothetical protein
VIAEAAVADDGRQSRQCGQGSVVSSSVVNSSVISR